MPLSTVDLYLRTTIYIVGSGQRGLTRRRGMFLKKSRKVMTFSYSVFSSHDIDLDYEECVC